MPIELSKITSNQFESLNRQKTVFFFPVGPLEDHGPHLPLGLDIHEAAFLCAGVAGRLERELQGWVGVLMPSMPLGVDSHTTHAAITVRGHVLRDWLVDCCRSLSKSGFCHFVCFSGNLGPRQLTAIEEAGRMIRKGWILGASPRPTLISASSAFVTWKDVLSSPFWPDPDEHGGQKDTSMALVVSQDSVDSSFAFLPKMERESSRWRRNILRRLGRMKGYWGSPAAADPTLAAKEMELRIDKIFPKMRAVWEGSNPQKLFRSGYSFLPPNKSFFKAWILIFMILFLITGWAFLNSILYQIE